MLYNYFNYLVNTAGFWDTSFWTPPISWINSIGVGGWEGGGCWGWVHGKPKAGRIIHWHRERAAVCWVNHKNSRSVHVRTRRSLGAVWHHMQPYYCAPVAPYTPQWTIINLHGQINAACKSRPSHPQPCHWSVWIAIVLECGFHVKL